jgi:hypothetical protein
VATLEAGLGAAGVSINRAGTLALVANRSEGTVSVFTISGNKLTPTGKIQFKDGNKILATVSLVFTDNVAGQPTITDKVQNLVQMIPVFSRFRNFIFEEPDRAGLRAGTGALCRRDLAKTLSLIGSYSDRGATTIYLAA